MRLSVLIPARNATETLGSSLRSTLRALPKHSEILLMDDGSDDGTAELASSLGDDRVRVFRSRTSRGVAASLNVLIDEAKGDFVARMDADDVTLPGRFTAQIARLSSGADFTFGGVIHFGRGVRLPYPSPPLAISPEAFSIALLIENPVAHSTMAASKEALNQLGGYRECLAEDYDLWLRASSQSFRLERRANPLTALRRHHGQVTASREWAQRAAAETEWQDAYNAVVERHLPVIPPALLRSVRSAVSTRDKRRILGGNIDRLISGLRPQDRLALSMLDRRAA